MSKPESARAGERRNGGRMTEKRRTGERLVAILIGGGAVLNFPLLSVLRGRGLVAGIPALYLYLFAVWALLAGATALVLRERPPKSGADDDGPARGEP